MDTREMLLSMRQRLPDAKEQGDELLLDMLRDAGALICALTWRQEVPSELHSAQVRLAVILYNRMGMEGESARQEGDVRRTVADLPEAIRREIFAYRRALT